MNNLIAISIGDINGIGIEIIVDLFKKNKIKNFVIFSNKSFLKKYLLKKKYNIKINSINKKKYLNDRNTLNIFSFNSVSNEENSLKAVKMAYYECKINNYIGLITLPLRKDLIINKLNINFTGHTEYLQKLDNKDFTNMIMIKNNLIISPLTTHIKINSVSNTINKDNYIFKRVIGIYETLLYDFSIKNPKILISGLNPHAGENGNIGKEELNIISPAITKLNKFKKLKIDGPVSGDSMLIDKNRKIYNCFIFITHDQALIPFKMISNFSGVNYTGNLDIIRVSPDHGTAYELVGGENISSKSIENCFKLIKKINKNRRKNESTKKIFRTKFSYR